MSRISPDLRARVTEAMDLCDLVPTDLHLHITFPEDPDGQILLSFFIGRDRNGVLTEPVGVLCDLWGHPEVTYAAGRLEAVWRPAPSVVLVGHDPSDELLERIGVVS